MKELQIQAKDKISLHAQPQKEEKREYIGTLRPKQGHTLFEIEVGTGDIRPATFESSAVYYKQAAAGNIYQRRVLVVKPGCIYKSCLNKKNARKHFEKYKTSI